MRIRYRYNPNGFDNYDRERRADSFQFLKKRREASGNYRMYLIFSIIFLFSLLTIHVSLETPCMSAGLRHAYLSSTLFNFGPKFSSATLRIRCDQGEA